MNLKDFLKTFNVHAPFYLSVLHNGVGSKYLIHYDSLNKNEVWMCSDVVGLDVSHHSYLGALLEVRINV